MATQLMIYETAVPVSHARHGTWSLEVGTDYAFCRNINSVPLMAAEFASAALEYAVVFGGTGDAVMPVTVLGVRADENLYVTKEGGWQAKYIPAFVRRYPFVFFSRDEARGSRFALTRPSRDLIRTAAASDCLAMMASRLPTWRMCSNSWGNTNANSSAPRHFAKS